MSMSMLQDVPADKVRLIVIANVILSPPDSYILLFTTLRYRAHVIKQGSRNGKEGQLFIFVSIIVFMTIETLHNC